jgi:hypothetical protein
MLYRKAYQNLAKRLCTQNNHQLVSQVCGNSWPLEPESLRAQFNEWARIERANHQKAHPEYKFTPAKPKPKDEDVQPASDDEWLPSRGAAASVARWSDPRLRSATVQAAAVYNPYSSSPNGTLSLGIHHSPAPPPQALYSQYQGQHQQQQHDLYTTSYYDGRRSSPAPSYHHSGSDLDHVFELACYPSLPGGAVAVSATAAATAAGSHFYTPQYGSSLPQQMKQMQHPVYQYGHAVAPQHHHHQAGTQHQHQHPHPQPHSLIDPTLMGADGAYAAAANYSLESAGTHALGLGNALLAHDPSGNFLRGNNEDWKVELDTVDWEKEGRH